MGSVRSPHLPLKLPLLTLGDLFHSSVHLYCYLRMLLRNFAVAALVANAAALDFNSSTWIWTNDSVPVTGGGATTPGARAFRRDFTPPAGKTPNFTDILVTGDESFTFYVNGEQLGTGANCQLAYAFRTPLPGSGPNVFAVTATSGSKNPNHAGVLVAIQLTYSDGTTDNIASYATWRAFTSVPDGYQNLTFDDSSWPAAVGEGSYHASAWGPVKIPTVPPALVLTNVTNWIWTNEPANASISAPSGSRPFRLTWTPPPGQTARSATISICADDEYVFFVNGNVVAGGYVYHSSQQFSISLAPAAKVVFAANTTNDNGPAGFIAEIQVTTAGPSGCTECSSSSFVITDASWKWTSTVPAGFEAPGFDDSSWFPSVVQVGYPVSFP
ncbi:hypothetical protein B0H19DRAFT_1266682 [Mycena capillaripes]|nr:hypothetical protein B0H19DRAFT_1266682 [Mycena capillaripes]